MKLSFKQKAIPNPSDGLDLSGEELITVPDQSLSLQEILDRFTRKESLPIANDGLYENDNDEVGETDLGKFHAMDIVDQYSHIENMFEKQKRYESELEQARAKALEEAKTNALEQIKAELKASQQSTP